MIGRFSQRTTSISNREMNLPLNSIAIFNFPKLFTTLLPIFGHVAYFAEIIGYGCKMISIFDIHQYLDIEDELE
jgi:hypothetical protein